MTMKRFLPAVAAVAMFGAVAGCGVYDAADAAPAPSANASASAKASAAKNPSASASQAAPTTHNPTPIKEHSAAAKLAATAWETTGAKDAQGNSVALTDANVKNYVGNAYYKTDGTFTMFNLDDTPKMSGDWAVSPNGKTRTLWVKDKAGKVTAVRIVPIVTLNETEFTYRITPNADNKAVYFDIIHTPTKHAEPKN